MRSRSVVFVIRDHKILTEKLFYEGRSFYSIPGGGIASAIMRNDLKRLGLRKQHYGAIEIWDDSAESQ